MVFNPLWALHEFGQSVWLDGLHRERLRGELARHINDDGISGVASDLSVFRRAIVTDPSYRTDLSRLSAKGIAAPQIYEQLLLQDTRDAADVLHRTYQRCAGRDGFVSVQISPLLANDTSGTLAEARRLWRALDRPNAMIGVPATRPGLSTLRHLISEGINVNATLIFGVTRYREVLDAFSAGLEDRENAGNPIDRVASVASICVNRLDTLVDKYLAEVKDADRIERARALVGKSGIAVARFIYQDFKKFLCSARWSALAASKAHPQRLVWASTATQGSSDSDVKYIDELIGRDTITSALPATLAAYRDHGRPAPRLENDLNEVAMLPSDLLRVGIDLEQINQQLETQEVQKLSESFRSLMVEIARLR